MTKRTQNHHINQAQLEKTTYEIIQQRLKNQAIELQNKLDQLNRNRKEVFGAVETQLIANERITTENNCIARDLVAIGDHFIFGYNVHMGLRTEIKLSDVFSVFRFDCNDRSFRREKLELIANPEFEEAFHNLYKYYKDTVFTKFALIGPHLFMVFQVGKSYSDIKTFKWAIKEDRLVYLGNRFDHEYTFPNQHEFVWTRATREMHRRGEHPHISILDRVFVEAVGGDLTIKVEDNTDLGQGIYSEPVDNKEQSLDDADFYFADLGYLIALKVRPYQEKNWRYILYNEKLQEVTRIDSLEDACVLLPDSQGIIFSDGYYLQTGDCKIFDNAIKALKFEKRITSFNGEDFLYVFYQQENGVYVLFPYNLVEQTVSTPIICNGFSIFPNGELCYFKAEETPGKYHLVQIWQTPYGINTHLPKKDDQSFLSRIGNKDLVKGMAATNELLTLLNKEDSYNNLYLDLIKKSTDILDSFYWITNKETCGLDEPIRQIRETASTAVDEFEKVRKLRETASQISKTITDKFQNLQDKIYRYKAQEIGQYVDYLSGLRSLRGELVASKEIRFIDLETIQNYEVQIIEQIDKLSSSCVSYLLQEDSLHPYQQKIKAIGSAIKEIEKVADSDEISRNIDTTGKDLELLIDIIGNLKIEDATQTTSIVDKISGIYALLNGLRAQNKRIRKELYSQEAGASFAAQMKLLDQSTVSYMELCQTPESCEEYLTKLMVHLEEIEGRFSVFDELVLKLNDKREEIYYAFESKKIALIETRNRRTATLVKAAERILKGIRHKSSHFATIEEIHTFFATDLMVDKIRDMVNQLGKLQDSVKAGDIQTKLKTLKEDSVRNLKDRTDLHSDSEKVIRLGRHNFAVNTQELDLTMVPKEGQMNYHLTGTNFFEKIEDSAFLETRAVWEQSLISENDQIYRAEYLAYRIWESLEQAGNKAKSKLNDGDEKELLSYVQKFMVARYQDGYVKGVHDKDATLILKKLLATESMIGLLRFDPLHRACAALYWQAFISNEEKKLINSRIKGAGVILQLFPNTREFESLLEDLAEGISVFVLMTSLFRGITPDLAASYLFLELAQDDEFIQSQEASSLCKDFYKYLKNKRFTTRFSQSLGQLTHAAEERFELIRNWVSAFVLETGIMLDQDFISEATRIIFSEELSPEKTSTTTVSSEAIQMLGEHPCIKNGSYVFNYHDFMRRLKQFCFKDVPLFEAYTQLKHELLQKKKQEIQLDQFQPSVMTSFVRNQLIDKVYLPLIGDNLAKQMGTVGENTRTDRMGLLLLISPPGYGKTSLMEYVASRMGLIFMKINGPAIGHEVKSLDPADAPNAASRKELENLNLSFEMGDNVMIYLDDIQHCNPVFLQKFISLCDAQRKIEGVYKGRPRSYDLRGKKVAVVMAGNPYTEQGEKFQIPDMLTNRADIYKLGDILEGNESAFKLSYIENALTSNSVLNRLNTRPMHDIHALIRMAESGKRDAVEFQSNFSDEEIKEIIAVLEKLLEVRDVILKVNKQYIKSAAQAGIYRKEPPFLLQGSYRNMNRLTEKISPVTNQEELNAIIFSHYENESQTLSANAEANMLKFKILTGLAEKTILNVGRKFVGFILSINE